MSPKAFLSLTIASSAPWLASSAQAGTQVAIFAGGDFSCMEVAFDGVPGVLSATNGYTGGTVTNPTHEQVNSGSTGHAEAVKVAFDPAKITYKKLLEIFWHNIDPLTKDAQFCNHGKQFRA